MKNKIFAAYLLIGMALGVVFSSGSAAYGETVRFVSPDMNRESADLVAQALESQSYLLKLDSGQSASDIRFALYGDQVLGRVDTSLLTWRTTSSEEGQYTETRPPLEIGRQPLLIVGETEIGGNRYAELLIAPNWFDTLGNRHQIDSIQVTLGRETTMESALQLRSEILNQLSPLGQRALPRASASSNTVYVIITNAQLAGSFESLRRYRIACGIPTTIVRIEDLVLQYSGRDDAERLRNFLKSFYESGGRHVLLGGDGGIVPIRYAYPYATTTPPALRDQLVCDLYYADLTGDWDVDSDGVWGERYEDSPDLTPELAVGRLPVDSPDEVATFVSKLIQYEANPGNGDPSYLGRSLFYSSDQMRDDIGGGQHHKIALAFPDAFGIDTTTVVEALSGNDPNPTNIGPLELPAALRARYGIVNVIAHGRFDGFVLKSSGYNESPKRYLLTRGFTDIQCAFDSVGQASSPSFYYSLACDNAGFDLDRPPFASGGVNMGRALLGSARGAVAMVANSRWGWINSSYVLHKAYFDSLFAHPGEPAIAAMYRAQKALWYYRDLIYGQLFLGDPLTSLYTTTPRILNAQAQDSAGICRVSVTSSLGRESNIAVTLSDTNGIIESGVTGSDGTVILAVDLIYGHQYTISCAGVAATRFVTSFTPSLATDANDDQSTIPEQFALYQNYPNPFNPSTVISFDLPKSVRVTISILNILGQEIDRPVDQAFSAGTHQVEWDSRDHYGRPLASGVYFYRLSCDDFTETRKLVLVR